MLGGIKKHGLAGAIDKQLGQWSEVVVAQAAKIEGGVEKHGLEGAVVKQVDAWISPEEQSKREAEEREREELRRKAEAEERDLREREELRRSEVEERELREKEELQKALQISRAEAEEREKQKKIEAEKPLPKKVPFKDFIYKFLERDPNLDDDKAFAAMEKVKSAQEMGDAALAQQLFSLNEPMINQHVIKWFITTDVIGDSDVFDL